MKFKLIQFAILLAFVMTIVFMAQIPNGFGHSLGGSHTHMIHPPEFHVDPSGDSIGPVPCPCSNDPRESEHRDYKDSHGNGTGSATSWALRYYASPLYNGDGGQVHTPADPNSAVQKRNSAKINAARATESQMVFGARVDLSASAGNSSCSGSVQPSLTDDMGLTSDLSGWSGQGNITLVISKKDDAHIRVANPFGMGFSYICVPTDLEETIYNPGWQDIEIGVSDTKLTNKKTRGIEGALKGGPASLTAKWIVENSVEREGVVYAYPEGIEVTLRCPWGVILGDGASQQDKRSNVQGNLGTAITAPPICTVFKGKHECYSSW